MSRELHGVGIPDSFMCLFDYPNCGQKHHNHLELYSETTKNGILMAKGNTFLDLTGGLNVTHAMCTIVRKKRTHAELVGNKRHKYIGTIAVAQWEKRLQQAREANTENVLLASPNECIFC